MIPEVLSAEQIADGRELVAALLERQPHADGHVGPHFLWPRFAAEGHPLLDFYRETGVGDLAGQLLRSDLDVQDPDFAQVATTIPPWPHRPGGPHVDGLTPTEPDGRPGSFSLLAGVWLTGHDHRHRGNLWVWPGTHLRFGQYLAERGADALARVEEMNPGPLSQDRARRADAGGRSRRQRPVRTLPTCSQHRRSRRRGRRGATRDRVLPAPRQRSPGAMAGGCHQPARRIPFVRSGAAVRLKGGRVSASG